MKAMILRKTAPFPENKSPLAMADLPMPQPESNEVLIAVSVCGICHTELDQIEGRISPMKLPVTPGHQVVGTIVQTGTDSTKFRVGDRVGVGWIFAACGRCRFCTTGYENLCDAFKATGKDVDGGYAEYMTAPENHVYPIRVFFRMTRPHRFFAPGPSGIVRYGWHN
jgi:propanol-preferring alcohol dehydrogenase